MGEKGKTIETEEGGKEEGMSSGKAVPLAFMKAASERRREVEEQRGALWSTEETPWRWRARAEALAGQWRMAWLNVSGSFPQRGQSGESPALNQEGWASPLILSFSFFSSTLVCFLLDRTTTEYRILLYF